MEETYSAGRSWFLTGWGLTLLFFAGCSAKNEEPAAPATGSAWRVASDQKIPPSPPPSAKAAAPRVPDDPNTAAPKVSRLPSRTGMSGLLNQTEDRAPISENPLREPRPSPAVRPEAPLGGALREAGAGTAEGPVVAVPSGAIAGNRAAEKKVEEGKVPGMPAVGSTAPAAAAENLSPNAAHPDQTAGAGARQESAPHPNPLPKGEGGTGITQINSLPKGEGETGKKPAGKGKRSGEPFDPIQENGPIFTGDWPKTPPQVALIITGQINGYIEPCGCAGLERMKGGLARRQTLFRQLREHGWPDPRAKNVGLPGKSPSSMQRGPGWPVVGLDVGGLARGFGKQAEIKFQRMVDGMRAMGYSAMALGVNDLKLPAGEVATAGGGGAGQPSLFVSANVALFDFELGFTEPYKIIEAGGRKLGVTAVLGKSIAREINNSEVVIRDPVAELKKVLPELMKKSDYRILLAHATRDESIALAKTFPEFNAVVTSGGFPEPPAQPEMLNGGKTLLIEVGEKGANAIVLALYNDRQHPWRYQRVLLDSRLAGSSEMKNLMAVYQDQLKTLGLAGLEIKAAPSPQQQSNGRYVGSEKCKSCHEESYLIWRKSKHFQAYKTLENADPPRNFDPECISCHVVGWNPTRYYPYESGFVSKEKTPQLLGVGCEDCHGPGELHCKAEDGTDEKAQEKYRKACRVTKEESKKSQCITCHDDTNSPYFDFDDYWPDVKHYENGEDK
jgi:hypothetical protein